MQGKMKPPPPDHKKPSKRHFLNSWWCCGNGKHGKEKKLSAKKMRKLFLEIRKIVMGGFIQSNLNEFDRQAEKEK